jgi:prepilin-type N-terminal cleavage/methylation domain-containing protein
MIRRIRNTRVGFTLIEILVVIAIIAVLAALITGAVMAVLIRGPDTQARQDMSGLSTGITLFKKDVGNYFPSRLLLSPNAGDYTNQANTLGFESGKQLVKLWGRINFTQAAADLQSTWGVTRPVILEGDQCLVFFLRGLNGTGFSADKTRPFASGGSRIGPWFDFPVARLKNVSHVNSAPADFPSFMDAFDLGRPYLYFASYGKTTGYHVPNPTANDLGDCQSGGGTGTTVAPYIKSMNPAVFYQPESFQIISAGRDGIFEANPAIAPMSGGPWLPGNGQGGDDLTNFAAGMLKAE